MPKYSVEGYYKVTKYVDRIVEADNMTEARHKAWSDDYEDEIERDEESISDFEATDVEEIG
jgi:hypothetical protein